MEKVPKTSIGRLTKGFFYPLSAYRFARQHKLVKNIIIPLMLSAVVYVVLVYFLFSHFNEIMNWLWTKPTGDSWWQTLLLPIWWLVDLLLRLLSFILSIFIFLLFYMVIAAPFNGALSERVEALRLDQEAPAMSFTSFVRDIFYAIRDLFSFLVFFVLVNIALLLLVFIPVIGGGVSLVLCGVFSMLMFTLEFMDPPMARRRIPFAQKWQVVRGNLALSLGFGACIFLLFTIPLAGLFLAPFACIAGTMLFCDIFADQLSDS